MATAALIALSLTTLTQRHLDDNRIAIWERKRSSYRANLDLALYFLKVFVAIFIVSCAFEAMLMAPARSLAWQVPRYRNEFASLFAHNCGVLLACALLALVYGSGALTLVLTWNALNWSQSLMPVLSQSAESYSARLVGSVALLPHLVCEVLGYVLAGMVGVFMGKALMKYKPLSTEFYLVSRACVVLLVFSLGALLLGSAFEVYLASKSTISIHEPPIIPRGGLAYGPP
ncbi:MAG: hypothetical protein RL518_922 [Pseudomonadota bacterium]